ncbi:MAG TPA: tyrosine-protein phosphatase [Pyrinomonadaceae bacterium]
MNKVTCKLSAVALALMFSAAVAATAQDAPKYEELPNFHQVNAHLYRGAQPRAGGVRRLPALGVRTVVNLRAADENSHAEEAEARAAGLQYFNVPLPPYARPDDEQIERALALIDAPENRPVFVHCKYGEDRTGTVVAAYRISREGWTYKRAAVEAEQQGMSRMQFEMKDFIADYYEKTVSGGAGGGGHRARHVAGATASVTRRTLEKSYQVAQKGLRRVGRAF